MVKPWPAPEEAVRLSVDDLALRILDRLDATPDDPMNSLLHRQGFINREVTEALSRERHRDRAMTVTTSEEGIGRFPEFAQALGEAWDYAKAQAWLSDDPTRPGYVRVTRLGESQLAVYRADRPAATTPTQAPPSTPQTSPSAASETALPAISPSATPASTSDRDADPAGRERREKLIDRWIAPTVNAVIAAALIALGGFAAGWALGVFDHGGGSRAITARLVANADHVVSGGQRLGAFYVVPRSIGQVPAPPSRSDHCVGRFAWVTRLGGIPVDRPVQLRLRAPAAGFTITGFTVVMASRRPAPKGSELECSGRGGASEHRVVNVEVSRTRPPVWQLEPTPADPNPTFVLPLDPDAALVLDVIAQSHGCLCSFRLRISYNAPSGDPRSILVPAADAPPLSVASAGKSIRYRWTGSRWQSLGPGLP